MQVAVLQDRHGRDHLKAAWYIPSHINWEGSPMQCPECRHIPLAGSQPDPARCPECGIFYQKAIELRRVREQQLQQQAASEVAAKKQAANALSPAVRAALADYRGAQPVVVLDVSMSFGAMVVFMIKWALAAIPAILILMLIGLFSAALFGGFIAGLGR